MIYENAPIEKVNNITPSDYEPCCMTPLYDAIGNVCTRLHTTVKDDESASVAVTIVTDGYENASREFSGKAIKALIEAYKQEGWMFAYIGADHDVESVAFNLSIDNTMTWEKTEEGTEKMAKIVNESRMQWADRVHYFMAPTPEERAEMKRKISKNFFKS